jgi:FdhD protein
MDPAREVPRQAWRDAAASDGTRTVAEETPIAMTYNRTTYAVMMATPSDLEDFAIGFSLTERVVQRADQIDEIEIVEVPDGIELRMWMDADRVSAVERRLRRIAGPTGCGLCGIDSLAEAARPPAPVSGDLRCSAEDLLAAMRLMAPGQVLNHATRAVHAAGFWRPGTPGLIALREDVGRHNALDKLAGALARAGQDGTDGAVLLTSRISVELVQKAAAIGAPVLAAVSAPTSLALRTAEAAGITLAGIVRPDGFELFTHPRRIGMEAARAAG